VGPASRGSVDEVGLVFVESAAKAERRPYHKKKLALLLANERHFALEQAARGRKIVYLAGEASIGAQLAEGCRTVGIDRLTVMRPAERELRHDLDEARQLGLSIDEVPDETWLTSPEEFRSTFPTGGPYRMDRFYRRVRQRSGVLMEGRGARATFTGGKVSFDAENRKPWRGDPPVPERPRFEPDEVTSEVLALVARRFPRHYGRLDGFDLPTTAADAERAWGFARAALLPHFGPFEDAMSGEHPDLFHTKVSGLLNLSRLLPSRLVGDVEADFRAGRLTLPSAEGFIRQILGWREFVHHVHEATDGFRTAEAGGTDGQPNALGAGGPLSALFWGARSGLACVDRVVAQVLDEGYSHHIARLMVLGNLATLCGWSPRALADWFWLAYIDAYDWVVEPNVLGMATYADGGLMTTKPYVSGAAYLHRMGDACGGCQYDPKRALGDGACPMTALYWSFIDRHQQRFARDPRMAMPVRSLLGKSAEERDALRAAAVATRARLDALTTDEGGR
jgi:deoxyribodipyrimidine photolyase-related protein